MSRFEIKIVAALLLIAIIPLAASVVLVDQVISVSDSVAEGQTRRLGAPLARAARASRALFAARKRSFELQARLIGSDRELVAAANAGDDGRLAKRIKQLLSREPGLGKLELQRLGQQPLVRSSKRFTAKDHRELRLQQPVTGTQAKLSLTFYTPRQPFDDFQALGLAQRAALEITSLRADLASYYRVVFLIIFGAVLLAATAVGIVIARRTTRKVMVLVQATREVASGDLDTRVDVTGRDELAELSTAFNEMVSELAENRERIGYLEKIGAWQEIARRLAHEIKNPLTPIKLAVQQLHQKYDGDSESFQRLLDDARDIITEEVEGLRRLVQAFSSFARLPNVQPEPVDLNSLVDDFFKSHGELVQRATRVDWEGVDSHTEVLVDRMLIKHVLYNLVENAVQAVEETGGDEALIVTLSAWVDEPRWQAVLVVEDNGPGMSGETAARIFDPYYTTKEQGTGLGLAIVKKIVLEHGGSITATSAPGKGARFVLTLPLVGAPTRQESAIRTTISRLLGAQIKQRVREDQSDPPKDD